MNQKNSQNNLYKLRHSCEHVLHQTMTDLFPGLKRAMGPATDEGFYHDFDYDKKVSETDFSKIEKRMQEIILADLPIIRQEISLIKAKKLFKNNPYKLDWIDQIEKKGEKAIVYWTGEPDQPGSDVDLCSGPHLKSTGEIKAFKLLSIAGAYWHGDEKNKMLTRIYGTAFNSKKDLDQYILQLKEAKKRDHRKLGKELDLFVISEDIGKGLPLLTPKGTIIKNQILQYERKLGKKAGFAEVTTPHIAKNDLYKRTGHWQHYQNVMYAPFGIDDETYVLKPMNCPHHYMIYESRPRSYKDLPFRLSEPGTCYRYEKTGELSGLIRVRALTIDDSHILMTEDQIESEFDLCIDMVKKMFASFGLKDYSVRLSLNDPDDNAKYMADAKTWKKAGDKLLNIVKKNNLVYTQVKGEASFYGPKIDFLVKDSIGREWQMSTLQLDLFMAKRLNLTYVDKKGSKKHPIILHLGLTGSLERTLGLLIEHFAGNFPTWLNPVQVKILPVSASNLKYARSVHQQLLAENIRAELNSKNETLAAKIRDAQLEKASYMLIVGDQETKAKTASIRNRAGKDLKQQSIQAFIADLNQEIEQKKITW